MIKAGLPVFFGCDVGKFSDRDAGVMDPELFKYEVSGYHTSACYLGGSVTHADRI